MERYLHGPTPVSASLYSTGDDIVQAAQIVHQKIPQWVPSLPQVGQFYLCLKLVKSITLIVA